LKVALCSPPIKKNKGKHVSQVIILITIIIIDIFEGLI
jgi:hypothetical protein